MTRPRLRVLDVTVAAACLAGIVVVWTPQWRQHGIWAGTGWLLATFAFLAGVIWLSGAHKKGGDR